MTKIATTITTNKKQQPVISALDQTNLGIGFEHHRARLYMLREFMSERFDPDTQDIKMLMLFLDDTCLSYDRFLKKLYRKLGTMRVVS